MSARQMVTERAGYNWAVELRVSSRDLWFTAFPRWVSQHQVSFGAAMTPDEARKLAHMLIIQADQAEFGAVSK